MQNLDTSEKGVGAHNVNLRRKKMPYSRNVCADCVVEKTCTKLTRATPI
jgi:hypothetical protein